MADSSLRWRTEALLGLFAPLVVVVGYLLLSISVFFFGPLHWPTVEPLLLLTFLVAILLAIVLGYGVGVMFVGGRGGEIHYRRLIRWGFYLALILFVPTCWVYTKRFPWEVFGAFSEQREAYIELGKILAAQDPARKAIAALRILSAPIVLAVLPLGVLRWRELAWRERAMVVACGLFQIAFSFLRGTDKEVGDVILIVAASTAGRFFRDHRAGRPVFVTNRIFPKFIMAMVVLAVAAGVFYTRKADRSSEFPEVCTLETGVCFRTVDSSSDASQRFEFFGAMISGYLSQGYYGLSLAMTQEFDSALGIGHSPFLVSAYQDLAGDQGFEERRFTSKVRRMGWDDKMVWSTWFTWIANDVGFVGVPFVVLIFAMLYGTLWRDLVLRENDRAGVLFAYCSIAMAFMPANSQLFQTGDSYFAVVVWFLLWARNLPSRSGKSGTA